MIQILPDLPEHVVGIVASGEVDANDYETAIIPAIESTLKAHGRVRILYQLDSSFTGFTPGALWDDMKVGVAHLNAWEKIAIVTDLDWVAGAIRIFGFVLPCPVKDFLNDEFDKAVKWISAD
jgi:hypothetical protein